MQQAPWITLWLVSVFALGLLAASIDVDSFFRGARISYTVRGNVRFFAFIILNGALSAAFLAWALATDSASVVNKIIQVDSPWAKMLVVGFAVPLLLRSKLFSFGEGQNAAGPAFAYDWMRLKVLYSINQQSAEKKDELAKQLAGRHAGTANCPQQLKGFVDDYVQPFLTQSQKDTLQREFDAIQGRYAGVDRLSEEHLRALIRWAIDDTDIRYIQRRLG